MENKIKVVFSGAQDTISGYGSRSRDLLHSLFELKRNEWDIKILSQKWGSCPFGLLDESDPKDKEILDNTVSPQEAFSKQPDGFIMVSVPNEMPPNKVGKYFNWVFTAGVETTVLPYELIQGCNNADLVVFSSKFCMDVANKTTFDQLNDKTKQKVGELKITTKTETLFEGVNENIYHNRSVKPFDLSTINESFCFLSVSHWLPGVKQLEDRKNLGMIIKTFLHTFKDLDVAPALILKTSLAGFSITENELILDEIDSIRKQVQYKKSLPNIYTIFGELTNEEINSLYNNPKVKVLIQCGNEGFGRPALEYSFATSKPILASPHSGHLDFLLPENNLFTPGELKPVGNSVKNKFIVEGSLMFAPNPSDTSASMKDMFINYSKYVTNGRIQGKHSRENFSHSKMTDTLKIILDTHLPNIPKQVSIKLPELKKIQLPKLNLVE